MLKIKSKQKLESDYRLYNLRAVVIDGCEYFANEHIRINTLTGVVVTLDSKGTEIAIRLYERGIICVANS